MPPAKKADGIPDSAARGGRSPVGTTRRPELADGPFRERFRTPRAVGAVGAGLGLGDKIAG